MNITTIPVGMLGTNCYLLRSQGGGCAVIDPGAQAEKLIRTIREEELAVGMILLTHGHHDHIGAVKRLMSEFPEAKLYIGEHDLEMLGDSQKSLAIFRNASDAEFIIGSAEALQDDAVLELDELRIRVIETPGHTKGGVTYQVENVLFTGDTLFREDVGRTDLYGGDYTTLRKSLARLVALEGDFTVYPGHGESTTLEYERRNNRYINDPSPL